MVDRVAMPLSKLVRKNKRYDGRDAKKEEFYRRSKTIQKYDRLKQRELGEKFVSAKATKRSKKERLPCRFFGRPKGCRAGDECPFAHVLTKKEESKQEQVQTDKEKQERMTQRHKWKRKLACKTPQGQPVMRYQMENLLRQIQR